MIAWKTWGGLVMTFLFAAAGSHVVADLIATHVSQKVTMGHVSSTCSHSLPQENGEHARVKILKMTYGPGERSVPHELSCPSADHTMSGSSHLQTQARVEKTKDAGASSKGPAGLPVFFMCDRDALPKIQSSKGRLS